MKKNNLLLVLVLTLFIASCSNEEIDSSGEIDSSSSSSSSSNSSVSGDIVGTWIAQTLDYTGTTVTETQGQTITANYIGEGYDFNYTLTISENPNNAVTEGSYSVELTTTTSGQTTVQNVENLMFNETSTWSLDGTQLTLVTNGNTTVSTITELTANTLSFTNLEVVDLSQQGATVTSTVNLNSTFTRQ